MVKKRKPTVSITNAGTQPVTVFTGTDEAVTISPGETAEIPATSILRQA